MAKKSNITSPEGPYTWKVGDPAPKEETREFWKLLRRFYRTGENKGSNKHKLFSPLPSLLESKERYPFKLHGKDNLSLEWDGKIPFKMLDHLLIEHEKENRKRFKTQISDLIAGLSGLFNLTDKKSQAEKLESTFDFADEMIAFDKMVDLIPKSTSHQLPERRVLRLHLVVDQLKKGMDYFNNQIATVVTHKKHEEHIQKAKLFKKVRFIKAKKNTFVQAQKAVIKQMHSFTELIKSYRIAKLEIEGGYVEEIHNDYFEHFTWHRMVPDELGLFHPFLMIVSHEDVLDQLGDFSKLLASNLPVNLVVINEQVISRPAESMSWEDASHQFRQELAAITLSHRNVYTAQTGMDNPTHLYEFLKDCLKSVSPGVCHLLIPENSKKSPMDLSWALAANGGRYFPSLQYHPNHSAAWGGRFNLTGNLGLDENWPQLELKAKTSKETEATIFIELTYADYKASFEQKASELMIIPSIYYTEDLIPLSDYLTLDENLLYGKIPYIWLTDEQNNLLRAAVPNVWVVSCQERLDFWNYLQEIAGVRKNSQRATDEAMDVIPEEQLAEIKSQHEVEIKQAKEAALNEATNRLAQVLSYLDQQGGNIDMSMVLGEPVVPTQKTAEEPTHSDPPEPSKTEVSKAQEISTDPWLETEECTSCNECTDNYPNLFAYNDEKLAYLKDVTKGTYEQLVKAAEKCPAACIHPGLPLNPEEPNVDKLIKRAEKFN